MNDQLATACNNTTIAQQGATDAQHGATPAQQSASFAQQSATVVAPPDSAATPDSTAACNQIDDPARNNCSANLLHLTQDQELALGQLIAGRRDADVARILKVIPRSGAFSSSTSANSTTRPDRSSLPALAKTGHTATMRCSAGPLMEAA